MEATVLDTGLVSLCQLKLTCWSCTVQRHWRTCPIQLATIPPL